jgi:hypothetical protein
MSDSKEGAVLWLWDDSELRTSRVREVRAKIWG